MINVQNEKYRAVCLSLDFVDLLMLHILRRAHNYVIISAVPVMLIIL